MGVEDVCQEATIVGGADDETVVVADAPATERTELAWSATTGELVEQPDDRRPLSRPLTFLLGAVCAGALALAAFTIGQHQTPRQPAPATTVSAARPAPAPPPQGQPPASPAPTRPPQPSAVDLPPAPTATPTPTPAALPDAYRPGLAATNPSLAAFVCRYLGSSGDLHAGAAAQQVESRMGWDFERSFEFVVSAVIDDCPQYRDR